MKMTAGRARNNAALSPSPKGLLARSAHTPMRTQQQKIRHDAMLSTRGPSMSRSGTRPRKRRRNLSPPTKQAPGTRNSDHSNDSTSSQYSHLSARIQPRVSARRDDGVHGTQRRWLRDKCSRRCQQQEAAGFMMHRGGGSRYAEGISMPYILGRTETTW